KPDIERPYKAFAYPFLPALYIIMGSVFCVFLVFFKPLYTLWGLGIVLAGIPVFYITIKNQKKIKSKIK
ncbi:MAG TPA: amino acid transporter, partial [Hanamia sp.]|nr:amino acid transporter [Hanamia sp.]